MIPHEWRDLCSSLKQRVAYMYKKEEMCDVHLIVHGEYKEQVFKSHKFLLGLVSPVFYNLLYGSRVSDILDINDTEPGVFAKLLQFIYTEEVSLQSQGEAWKLWYAANKYHISLLVKLCEDFIIKQLNTTNILQAFESTQQIGDNSFLDKCLEIMDNHMEEILCVGSFRLLSKDNVINIVKRATLSAREVTIFKAVVEWGLARTQNTDGTELRNVLNDILPYINFPAMSQKDFMEVVTPSDVLTAEEWNDYARHIMDQSLKSPDMLKHPQMRYGPYLDQFSVILFPDMAKELGRFDGSARNLLLDSGILYRYERHEGDPIQISQKIMVSTPVFLRSVNIGICICADEVLCASKQTSLANDMKLKLFKGSSLMGAYQCTVHRCSNRCVLVVVLPIPLLIRADSQYTVAVTLNDGDMYSFCVPRPHLTSPGEVTQNGVIFKTHMCKAIPIPDDQISDMALAFPAQFICSVCCSF